MTINLGFRLVQQGLRGSIRLIIEMEKPTREVFARSQIEARGAVVGGDGMPSRVSVALFGALLPTAFMRRNAKAQRRKDAKARRAGWSSEDGGWLPWWV